MAHTFPIGARVLVDGRDEAIVKQAFPKGSSSYAFPHYKVDMVGGDKNVAIKMDRVGVDRKKSASMAERVVARFMSAAGHEVMQLASKLAHTVHGSTPKHIGAYRWSEKNDSAQFSVNSPENGVEVVCVVSLFEDGTAALGFFNSEHLSETNRFENISSFTYDGGGDKDMHEMVKDIKWVMDTVDEYKASWESEQGGDQQF
jgi:hypothetical protein